MNARKKTALGLGVSGLLSMAVAIVMGFTQVDPAWLQPTLKVIAGVAPFLGIIVVMPKWE